MQKKLLLAVAMAVTGALLMVAAGVAGTTGGQATRGGTLRVLHDLSDYEYVDPQKCYDTGCSEMLWSTSYQLMQYPEKNGEEGKRVYPEAATGFPVISKNGKTYTFTVKPAKASNGKTVDAQWFVHAFERLLNPKMGDSSARSGAISILADVVGIQAYYDGKAAKLAGVVANGNKLTIRLTRANPALLSILGMNWFTATDPALPYDEQGVNTFPAAGPYYIKARDISRSLTLVRNPNYQGTRPANPDVIQITVNGDQNQGLLQVRAGQQDYQPAVPSASVSDLIKEYGVNKKQFWVKPTIVTSYIGLNTASGPFAKANLRQAANWAADRPAFLRIASLLAGKRTDQILPPGMPGYKPAKIYPVAGANVSKAKELAGNVSGLPTVNILHGNSTANINRGQVFKYNLEQMGLKATAEAVPSSQLFSRAGDKKNGKYDAIFIGWQADYPDPSNFINVLLDGRTLSDEGSSPNVAYFNSDKFNKLMDAALGQTGDARYKAFGNLDIQLMKEAAPWIPWLNTNNRIMISSRVSNFIYNDANTNTAYHAFVVGK